MPKLRFVFWLTAFLTMVLVVVKVAEFVRSPLPLIDVKVIETIYIALLSIYVGAKEVQRWSQEERLPGEAAISLQAKGFRVPGELFVGLWTVFAVVATLAAGYGPAHFVYPIGLSAITYKVLGFYLGSGASKWLKERLDQRTDRELERDLEKRASGSTSVTSSPRVIRKRERYERLIVEEIRAKGSVTRTEVEVLLKLSKSSTVELLAQLVNSRFLQRNGEPGDTTTRYTLP